MSHYTEIESELHRDRSDINVGRNALKWIAEFPAILVPISSQFPGRSEFELPFCGNMYISCPPENTSRSCPPISAHNEISHYHMIETETGIHKRIHKKERACVAACQSGGNFFYKKHKRIPIHSMSTTPRPEATGTWRWLTLGRDLCTRSAVASLSTRMLGSSATEYVQCELLTPTKS